MFPILRKLLIPTVAVSTVVLFAMAQDQDGQDHAEHGHPVVGKKAQSFKASTIGGEKIDLATSFKGKVVLVDFWATWCPPCLLEIPHIKEAYKEHHEQGFEIVSVSLDAFHQISSEKVSKFVKKNEMKWAHVYEGWEEIAQSYGVTGIPAAFLIDGDSGTILAMGNDLRGKSLIKSVKKHVRSKQKK